MRARKVDSRFFLRIDRGEEIVGTLTAFLDAERIAGGAISGIGAVEKATLQYYDIAAKQYYSRDFAEAMEIVSLLGNVSLKDGKPWPHLHVILSDTNFQCFGGHLASAIVGVTCELIIDQSDVAIERSLDEETGLKLWSL